MKITYWCLLVVLSPVTALGTTISAYSHMEEHIQVLDKTDGQSAGAGVVASYVESKPQFEHYLQGYTSAQADVSGSLSVAAVGLDDLADSEDAYFTSTASWSQNYVNDDAGKNYFFDFDISDINIGADYRTGSSNRTGYELAVLLDGNSIFDYQYIFDTSELAREYSEAMMNGALNPPPGTSFLTIDATTYHLDLGAFAENENFTLQYQITGFAQPIDVSSNYINFDAIGNLYSETVPVPEPATMLLLGIGLGGGFAVRIRRKRA